MNSFKSTLAVILLSTLIFSCKSDSTDTTDLTAGSNEVVAKLSPSAQRAADSLAIVKKIGAKGEEYSAAEISVMLDEQAKANANRGTYIPPVCSMIELKEIAEMFDAAESEIIVNSGNRGKVKGDKSKSCFWRWGNAGLLMQVSTNPLPDEINDWCSRYISTKKSSGEQMMEAPDQKFIFKDFEGPGKYNIYNENQGRFYVAKGEDYIIALIFNGDIGGRKKLKIANKLLSKVYSRI